MESRPFRSNGEKLDQLLRERDMNQADLSRLLKVSEAAVSAWVLGTRTPSRMNTRKIEEALHLPRGYFDMDLTTRVLGREDGLQKLELVKQALTMCNNGVISEETLKDIIRRFGD